VDELRTLFDDEKVPARVKDAASMPAKFPEEFFTSPLEYRPAAGAVEIFVSPLQPSDFLLEILAATRAAEWEEVIVLIGHGHWVSPKKELSFSAFPRWSQLHRQFFAQFCVLDGEAVASGEDGIALFERIRYRRYGATIFVYAFDLIALNGDDLRREPLDRSYPC
jgi:hypothetical protein